MAQRILIQTGKIIGKLAVYMPAQGTDRLHQTTPQNCFAILMTSPVAFICVRQLPARADEFIKQGRRGIFTMPVVQHRLKARIGFSGNRIS